VSSAELRMPDSCVIRVLMGLLEGIKVSAYPKSF
jgi:hypothetical protein